MLARTLSREEAVLWRPWVLLTLADLRRALGWPAERRTGEWRRWLFEIPYSNPVNRHPGPAADATVPGAVLRR